MSTQPIDYDALAKQAGAVSSAPDYDAMAKQAGAISSTPAPQPKAEDAGLLSKAWKVINTPLADLAGGDGTTKRAILQAVGQSLGIDLSPENLAYQAQRTDAKHPAVQGIRAFLAGSAGDTADMAAGFTSPVALGTAAIGTAAKGAGAAAKVAKVVAPMVSAGFAAKGAKDVVDAGTSNTPEAWQQRLQGGAMVAGGAAGAGEGIKSASLPDAAQAFAGRMYQSALKPSLASNSAAEIKTMVQTGLDNGIPVSAGGAQKLSGLIDDLNSKVKAQIASNPNAPINKYAVSGRLADVAKKFETQVNPEKDLQIVANSGNEFLRNQPSDIGAANAQDLKVGTYKQLQAKYGELKTAQIESEKALARGLKEELEMQFPEIKDLNARESKLIGLDDALQGAVKRIQNRNLVGLTPPLVTAGLSGALGMMGGGTEAGAAALAGGMLHFAIEDPFVKSRLAIALNHATRGKLPANGAALRIAAYSTALANSLPQNHGKPQEQTSQPQQ